MQEHLGRFSQLAIAVFLCVIGLSSCEKDDSDPPEESQSEGCDSLYSCASYPVGMAVRAHTINISQDYGDIVRKHFNSITAGNSFKPDALHPQPDQYNFGTADNLADFCEEFGKRLHGHTLIWHSQIPDWMENYEGTSAQWDSMMKVHIQSIVTHFKGRASSWDVVNEAFMDDGSFRESVWYKNIGPDYIKKAFHYAHEADPEALLFYNDYNMIYSQHKHQVVVQRLSEWREEGVPIHGIGLQSHININTPKADITEAIEAVADAGFLVHISELDVSVNPNGEQDFEPTSETWTQQAKQYEHVVTSYNAVPADLKFGITVWGVTDATSWIPNAFNREDYPLLFDKDYEPKLAFQYFKKSLE